jgi:hypothetical protein
MSAQYTKGRFPTPAPRIWRDNDRLYLEFETGTIIPYELSQGGLWKALQHVPYYPTLNDVRRQLAPDWAAKERKVAIGRDKQGRFVKPRKTKEKPKVEYKDEHLKSALDAIHKVKK